MPHPLEPLTEEGDPNWLPGDRPRSPTSRYMIISAGAHAIALVLFLFNILPLKSKRVYYGIDFVPSGASGMGAGAQGSGAPQPVEQPPAPAPAPTPIPEKPSQATKKEEKLQIQDKTPPKKKAGATAKKDPKANKKSPAPTHSKGSDATSAKAGPEGKGTSLVIGGPGGGGGNLSKHFPYAWYINILHGKLYSAWDRPDSGSQSCTVAFTIGRDGAVSDVEVDDGSGDSFFDMQARRAVDVSAPFPPLPQDYKEASLRVVVRFNLDE